MLISTGPNSVNFRPVIPFSKIMGTLDDAAFAVIASGTFDETRCDAHPNIATASATTETLFRIEVFMGIPINRAKE